METEFRLKNCKLNIRLFFLLSFVIPFVAFPFYSKAQKDTIPASFQFQFKKNLTELNELYCWSDASFYPGKFNMTRVENIQTAFQNLNLTFFTDLNNGTEAFFQFLGGLENGEKQNLVRYFSFYENEIESALKSNNLPIQLKYLAPALSAMNPKAVGLNGKAGLFQLTHFQAVLNGAGINNLVDERFNESISIFAAASELKQNFMEFETPELAITAFFVGRVKVKNAIRNAENLTPGFNTFAFLPNSVNEYIAAFQALAIFLNVNQFEESIEPFTHRIALDTAWVNRQIHFQQITDVLGITKKQLQFLNPQYKFLIVPGNEKPSKIVLPNDKGDDFVLWQDSIYNTYDSILFQLVTQKIEYPPSPNRQYINEPVKNLEIEGKTKIKYRLKSGDVLGIIAEDFDVRVEDLKYWNNIYNERKIQAGKNLDIFVDNDKTDYYLSLAAPEKNRMAAESVAKEIQKTSNTNELKDLDSAKKVEHIVKNGESPYVIAKKYKGVTPDEILEWNNIDDSRKIQIGQKLIVYIK